MNERRLVEKGWDGTSEYAHFDADGNFLGLEYQSDVEPIIDANKRAQNDGSKGYGKSREWRQIASIPPSVLMDFAIKRYGNGPEALAFMNTREAFDDICKKLLQDPDYRYLRTDL